MSCSVNCRIQSVDRGNTYLGNIEKQRLNTRVSIRKKRRELLRLQGAFEIEASRFHDLSLSILYLTQMKPPQNRIFQNPSHVIMLWQYYGLVSGPDQTTEFLANVQESDLTAIGVRGSEFSCYAALEGPTTDLFVRMAKRAGSIFSEKELHVIKTRCFRDLESNQPPELQSKPVFVGNDNPLAVWLNYVLHHLGRTHPQYLPEVKIALDPFAASLSAIDSLLESGTVDCATKPSHRIDELCFRVSLSFPGERRPYVEQVADSLRMQLGDDAVFYDNYFQPELARPNLDLLLQRIYREKSDLVVVFLCADYTQKQWCGLEWRAVRDLIKEKGGDRIMVLRFDNEVVPGLFGIDGYLDIRNMSPIDLASAILHRLCSTSPRIDHGTRERPIRL